VTHVYLLSSSLPMASSSSVSLGFRSTTDVENVSYGDQALFSSNHPALWLRCHGTGLSFVTPWPSLPLHCTTLFRLFDPWSLYPHIAPHDQPRHVLSGCLGGCIRCPSPPTLTATPTLIVSSARKLTLVLRPQVTPTQLVWVAPFPRYVRCPSNTFVLSQVDGIRRSG
jgi:hypothetical protein